MGKDASMTAISDTKHQNNCLDNLYSKRVPNRLELRQRANEIKAGWSAQERVDRFRVGEIGRTWMSNLAASTQTQIQTQKEHIEMLGLKQKATKLAFNARILTNFGKLDQRDIVDINGCTERLLVQLMERYGWSFAFAQTKVDRFNSVDSNREIES